MSSATPATPFTAGTLIRALESTGPRPALAWHGHDGRVELSGHVLANWIIKAGNHLRDEVMLEPGGVVALAMPPHWKRLVIALAAWSIGAEVRMLGAGSAGLGADGAEEPALGTDIDQEVEPAVLVTDDPAGSPEAEETLAVDPVSLAMRFSGELPPMVHDWVVEVRGHADEPTDALDLWSGPEPAEGGEDASAGGRVPSGGGRVASGGGTGSAAQLVVRGDGLGPDGADADQVPTLLGALLTGHIIVGGA